MKKFILIMLCVVICGCNNVKEKETFINVKSKEVHILENENYNYLDNIVSSNNEKIVCQKNNDTINCKLDNKEVSYKIIYTSVTKNKNIIFLLHFYCNFITLLYFLKNRCIYLWRWLCYVTIDSG